MDLLDDTSLKQTLLCGLTMITLQAYALGGLSK